MGNVKNQNNLSIGVIDPEYITIEVAYAGSFLFSKQTVIRIEVPNNLDIEQAIIISKILNKNPEIDLRINKVGIFGELRDLSTKIKDGDRIEIYKKLHANPNKIRKGRIIKNQQIVNKLLLENSIDQR